MRFGVRKRRLILYLLATGLMLAVWSIFLLFEMFHFGIVGGICMSALAWSLYVLCVPALHGRLLFEAPMHFFTGHRVYPEPFMWTLAASVNIVTLFFNHELYTKTFSAGLLYLVLTTPRYWIILCVGLCGAWFRLMCGKIRYDTAHRTFVLARYLLFLFGLFLFLYLMRFDAIVLLNAMANG